MGLSEQELAEIEKWCGTGDMLAPLTPQLATILRLTEEIHRLRQTLAWYADRDNWNILLAVRERCPVERDKGQRARDALEGK